MRFVVVAKSRAEQKCHFDQHLHQVRLGQRKQHNYLGLHHQFGDGPHKDGHETAMKFAPQRTSSEK